MYVALSTEISKCYHDQKGGMSLEDGLQVGVKTARRLTLFYDNWAKVNQDQWVLDTMQGYGLELLGRAIQTVLTREAHTSSLEQNFIEEEIQNQL